MTRHLVRTVENSSTVINIFDTEKSMNTFIKKFNKTYKGKTMDGWWIDLVVTNIQGEIIDDGRLIE